MAIAGDSLTTFGDTRLAHGYEANDKLFRIGDSWIGMAGTMAHFPVLRKAMAVAFNCVSRGCGFCWWGLELAVALVFR